MSISRCLTMHCDTCYVWVQSVEDQPLARFRRVCARMGWGSEPRRKGSRSTTNWCPKCNKAKRMEKP